MALGMSTIYADYQDIKEYASAVAAVRRGRGDLSGHAPDREAFRGEPVPLPGEAGGRRHSCPQRGRVVLLR